MDGTRAGGGWRLGLTAMAIVAVLQGCTSPGAPASKGGTVGSGLPGIEETSAIAEEAYIYGLPLVMNYAAMYDMAVNRDSGQFKAPFNEISSEARVFTPDDTAVIVPNSDTPYSMLSPDLRAEPMVLSVPGRTGPSTW